MPNPVFAGLPTSIFQHMTVLALEHDAINLGQGFPDQDGPLALRAVAAKALIDGPNQYPPSKGLAVLRQAVSAHARRFYGLAYDPEDEVLITSGGTEAIAGALMALAGQGDTVVMIEPTYDSYRPMAEAAGAVVKTVKLAPPGWRLTEEVLRSAIGPETRAVLINSPHNPAGRVFSREEMETLAKVVRETDAVVICDEVYEHLVFDGLPHIPLASLPGMRERTLRISSAGKTFSCTGWKVGWATGPAPLVSAVQRVKQFLTFVNASPLQPAVAVALGLPDTYYTGFRDGLQKRRDLLVAGLTEAGFAVLPSAGTYFVTADIRPLAQDQDGADFCRELPERCGVVAVPTQVFYDHPDEGRHLIRFAFCKREEVIDEAARRLQKLGRATR